MERETKQLTTVLGKSIIIKSYLTARESRDIRGVLLNSMSLSDIKTGGVDFKPTSQQVDESENKTVELIVVEYDCSKENILERLLNSPSQELESVMKICEEVKNPPLAMTK